MIAQPLLRCDHMTIATENKILLHDITFDITQGSTHLLMGPNGAGKSTLGKAIMGDPQCNYPKGLLIFDGQEISKLSCDKRSKLGIFMSFQTPIEVKGVALFTFLRAIVANSQNSDLRGNKLKTKIFEIMDFLHINHGYLDRDLNVGFSGGEKKKVEMLQLLLLKPKLAILDEIDSGLDIDALDIVSSAIKMYLTKLGGTILMITHNTKILERLDIDSVHILVQGRLVESGKANIINEIDNNGFERYISNFIDA